MREIRRWVSEAPLCTAVLIICVLVTVFMHILDAVSGLTSASIMILFGAYYKAFISAGEWWRLVTCGFVHWNLWHLVMNLYAFLGIGPFLERHYGKGRFAILLLGSIAGGSAAEFIAHGNTLAVGLSGGIYGLMAAFFLLVFKAGGWTNPAYRQMILRTVLINLLINFLPNVATVMHIGGLVVGGFLGELLAPDALHQRQNSTRIAFVLLVVLLTWGVIRNRQIPNTEYYLGTDQEVLQYENSHGLSGYARHLAGSLDELYGISGYTLTDALGE